MFTYLFVYLLLSILIIIDTIIQIFNILRFCRGKDDPLGKNMIKISCILSIKSEMISEG